MDDTGNKKLLPLISRKGNSFYLRGTKTKDTGRRISKLSAQVL